MLEEARTRQVYTSTRRSPLLKWPGGKTSELDIILPNLPTKYECLIEPFVGGGALFWALNPVKASLNDLSVELIAFYNYIATANAEFLDALNMLAKDWDLLTDLSAKNLPILVDRYIKVRPSALNKKQLSRSDINVHDVINELFRDFIALSKSSFIARDRLNTQLVTSITQKILRMQRLEQKKGELSREDVFQNIFGALKAGYYTYIREIYNDRVVGQAAITPLGAAIFFFIREYCYASMFRYSKKGHFNVPFGGISYARKSMIKKVENIASTHVQTALSSAMISCQDFETFLSAINPNQFDFIFVDPPYDSDFSTYSNNAFTSDDQKRLATQLTALAQNTQIMVVIKATPLIEKLYPSTLWNVRGYDKTYMWTIKERNDRETVHLMITNY